MVMAKLLTATVKVSVTVWAGVAESVTCTLKVALPVAGNGVEVVSRPVEERLKPSDARLLAPVAPEVTVQV